MIKVRQVHFRLKIRKGLEVKVKQVNLRFKVRGGFRD